MCEFKATLDGKNVFNDVVYAKAEGDKVILRDILGETKEFRNCKIIEVDVTLTRLILSSEKTREAST
jgi:predicted RNA-binding protein